MWLYFRFPLSLWMVEEMLAVGGVTVSHETAWRWALKFGREIADRLRRRAPRRGDKWRLDEVVLTIAGEEAWLGAPREGDGQAQVPRRGQAGSAAWRNHPNWSSVCFRCRRPWPERGGRGHRELEARRVSVVALNGMTFDPASATDRLAPKVLALAAEGRGYRLIGREPGLGESTVAAMLKRARDIAATSPGDPSFPMPVATGAWI